MKKTVILLLLVVFLVFCTVSAKNKKKKKKAKKENLMVCDSPLWNADHAQNWPLAGIMEDSKPTFELVVKGLDHQGRYRPRKLHKVIVRVQKKKRKQGNYMMNGFYITLHPQESADPPCNTGGNFIGSRLRRAGVATLQPGCSEPLLMDYQPGGIKSSAGKWRAPSCGNVTMRAVVRTIINEREKLFYDEDGNEEQHQALTKILRPIPA